MSEPEYLAAEERAAMRSEYIAGWARCWSVMTRTIIPSPDQVAPDCGSRYFGATVRLARFFGCVLFQPAVPVSIDAREARTELPEQVRQV